MSKELIGCCGAYCKTCRVYTLSCRGCKPGYADGMRDISRARCAMKVCCFRRGHQTCADCADFETCDTVQGFYSKNGYKYGKYKQAADYIRAHGYAHFLKIADTWRGAYGRYE